MIMSLVRMPAFAAEFRVLLTSPSSMVTSMPRPPNSPRVCTCISLRIHVARMRIEPAEYPVDCPFDELGVVGLVHIMRAHTLKLRIMRKRADKPIEVSITRAIIHVDLVRSDGHRRQ